MSIPLQQPKPGQGDRVTRPAERTEHRLFQTRPIVNDGVYQRFVGAFVPSKPARGGVKPHVSLTTTVEALKGELGAPAVDVEFSLPVSSRTLERFACDCTMSRVLMADSQVIDVGRATRVVSGPTRRALKARDKGCRFPGCDRPVNWTSPHHIEFWARGGPTNVPDLVSVCHYHHRLVHEGGWQVVKVGREFRFLPPGRAMFRPARGPGVRWAA